MQYAIPAALKKSVAKVSADVGLGLGFAGSIIVSSISGFSNFSGIAFIVAIGFIYCFFYRIM
ncbi:MAG: hypothetical protein WBB28_27140 [Crinalium sp.]